MPAFLRIRRRIFLLPLQGFCGNWLGVSGFKLGVWLLVLIPLPWRAGLPGWGMVFLWKNKPPPRDPPPQLKSYNESHAEPWQNPPPPRLTTGAEHHGHQTPAHRLRQPVPAGPARPPCCRRGPAGARWRLRSPSQADEAPVQQQARQEIRPLLG